MLIPMQKNVFHFKHLSEFSFFSSERRGNGPGTNRNFYGTAREITIIIFFKNIERNI